MRHTKKIISGVIVATFMLANPMSAMVANATTVTATQAQLSYEQAKKIADAKVPTASQLMKWTLDDNEYEFDYFLTNTWYEVTVDPWSGDIEVYEWDRLMDRTGKEANRYQSNQTYKPSITVTQANNIAKKLMPADAKVSKTPLKVEDGYYVYEVAAQYTKNQQVTTYVLIVDAETGFVVSYRECARSGNDTPTMLPSQVISKAQAMATAAKLVPSTSQTTFVELDEDDDQWYYEVNFISKDKTMLYEIKVDAAKNVVLQYEEEVAKQNSNLDKDVLSIATIKTYAQKIVPEGKFTSVELERDDNVRYYDIDMITSTVSYDLELDATTGTLLKMTKDFMILQNDDYDDDYNDDNNNNTKPVPPGLDKKMITKEAAMEIAVAKVNGATVTDCDLDKNDGNQYVYEIELRDSRGEYDLKINAYTGEIIALDVDLDDDDNDDYYNYGYHHNDRHNYNGRQNYNGNGYGYGCGYGHNYTHHENWDD